MKDFDLQDNDLAVKLIKEAINEIECGQFEIALEHKSKLRMYNELKGEIKFVEYLKYIKGAPSTLFLKFCSGTHVLFEELGWHAGGDGSQKCCNCEACIKIQLNIYFLNVHHTISKDQVFGLLKTSTSSRCV